METPSSLDPATIRAIGNFATVLMTFLHRERVLDIAEFADFLALYSTVTGEADPDAGLALAYWAGRTRQTTFATTSPIPVKRWIAIRSAEWS